MSDQMTESIKSPEYRTRLNITKNTKGYGYETTVEVSWAGDPNWVPTSEGLEPLEEILRVLNLFVDDQARAEIARREALDAEMAA